MSIIKKWLFVLVIIFSLYSLIYSTVPMYKKCILYFNIVSYFISILFLWINVLAEKQPNSKKLGYTLGAIGNKFLLSIMAFIGYFYYIYKKDKIEILIAFGIFFSYFVVSYYFLFQLSKQKK